MRAAFVAPSYQLFFGGVVLVIPLCQAKTTCVFKEMQEHPDSLHNVSSSFL